MAEEFLPRFTRLFKYARKHPRQGVVMLIIGIPALLLLNVAQHRLGTWEDDFIKEHGDKFIYRAGTEVLDWVAIHPVWSITIFFLSVLLGMLVHAYVVTNKVFEEDIPPEKDSASQLRIMTENVTMGLRRSGVWQGETFLFVQCRMISPAKDTSITKIIPLVATSNGECWTGVLIEDLSDWNLSAEGKSDIDLESLSLWKKLKESGLQKEMEKSGWLGILVYRNLTDTQLAAINRIELSIEDGGGTNYSIPLQMIIKKDPLIVAKHLSSTPTY